ncbi:MAG TPA: efflux RND transporter periplasmic adaptor subunit [Dongiaceae bacterium]|nr:efflux RND transporter periplasmic adaptor subunit [Dongiaceae bacterium]
MSDNPHPKASGRTLRWAGVGVAAIFAAILAIGFTSRSIAQKDLHQQTVADSIVNVSVVLPKQSTTADLVLPGRLEAWSSAPVFARTNGYIKNWYADIGTEVKTGQLLADIDAPDLDQQLAAAEAAVSVAQAQRDLAAVTTERWDRLVADHNVSVQAADEKRSELATSDAQLAQAKANVRQLQALTSFKRLIAPFDGVVTSRATDIGALIVSGNAQAQPLFTVSDINKLRIYVNVPQAYQSQIFVGQKAQFSVPDHLNQTFNAQVVNFSNAVDPQSGAMLIQLSYENPDHALKPGGYAQVSLKLPKPSAAQALRIPSAALLFRSEGTAVAVVDQSNHVAIKPIEILQDHGAELDVSAGIKPTDRIISNPPDAIDTGDQVNPIASQGG